MLIEIGSTYASSVGTAKRPEWVSRAPGCKGLSVMVRKLLGIPELLLKRGSITPGASVCSNSIKLLTLVSCEHDETGITRDFTLLI